VVEIVLRSARHALTLPDAARAPIGGHRQSDDLLQPELAEAVIERRPGGLGRVALTPIAAGEPPGDLHGRGEVSLIGNRLKTDDTDKARFAG